MQKKYNTPVNKMNIKKSPFLACVLLACALCSCSGRKETQKGPAKKIETGDSLLRIAVMPTLDCLPIYVAHERGWFDEERIPLRPVRYTAQMDCDTALLRGRVEGAATDLVRAHRLQLDGLALRYATATNLSWQLYSHRAARIKTISQLADKMVGMTRHSATHLLAQNMVDSAKPKSEVFNIQINDVNIRQKMLLGNEIDAAFLPEPQASAARRAGHSLLMDTHEKDLRLGVIVFRNDGAHRRKVSRALPLFLKVYNRACDSINLRGFASYADVLAKYYRLSLSELSHLPIPRYMRASAPREQDLRCARNFQPH